MHKRLATLLLTLCMLFTLAVPALAAPDLRGVDDFYTKQQTNSTCTLASAAMMMRRRGYLDGIENWSDLTEGTLRRVAWSYVGLSHEFTSMGMTVKHGDFETGASVETQLQSMLKEHPEGIVVYNKSVPHAILVTDYTSGAFYCSDPSSAAPSGRVPVSQASISITNARYYWYVAADTNRPVGVGGSLAAEAVSYPSRLAPGSAFGMAGQLTSPGNITNVSVTISTDAGSKMLEAASAPNAPTYDVAELAPQLDFASLPTGVYTMQFTADDDYGARISLRKQITVAGTATNTASYTGKAPIVNNINAVNLVQTGFDVECTATDEDSGAVSVLYSAWADGKQFTLSQVADRDGEKFTTHINADAATMGIDSFLINITVMDADGNSARGALLVKVGIEDLGNEEAGAAISEQTVI